MTESRPKLQVWNCCLQNITNSKCSALHRVIAQQYSAANFVSLGLLPLPQGKIRRAYTVLTNCTQQIPSTEANRLSVSQEILSILRKPNVHYRIHNTLPPAPMSQINPVHALTTHLKDQY